MKIQKMAAALAAATMTCSMISSLTASATIPELMDFNNEFGTPTSNSSVKTTQSSHTYTYYQIFRGTWFDENRPRNDASWPDNTLGDGVWLSDAQWGEAVKVEELMHFLQTNYSEQIKTLYLNRAIKAGLVPAGTTTIAAVKDAWKTAYQQRTGATDGDAKWSSSDYNPDYFEANQKPEDVLDLFKQIQKDLPNAQDANAQLTPGTAESNVNNTDPNNNTTDQYGADGTAIGMPNDGAVSDHTTIHGQAITEGNNRIVDILSGFIDKTKGHNLTASYNQESTTASVQNGYYLIEEHDEGWDKEGRDEDDEDRYATLMRIVDREITITPKIGTPTVEKKIAENQQAVTSVGDGLVGAYSHTVKNTNGASAVDTKKWNDAADYSIGDLVPFTIYGSMPDNIADYDAYFYQFKDRLAKGFVKPEASAFRVEIGHTDPQITQADGDNAAATRNFTVDKDITANAKITFVDNADGSTQIKVTFDDIKSITGTNLDLHSTVRVRYQAQLDTDAVIGRMGNTNGTSLVYSTDVNYDGRGFTNDTTSTTPGADNVENNTKGGKKTTTSETLENGVTTFTYQLDVTKVDGEDNKVLQGAIFTLQAKDGDHNGQYVAINADRTVNGWDDSASSKNYLTTDENGKINVIGLDDGKYELVEIKAPRGYNSLRYPVPVTLDGTLNNNGTYDYIPDDGSAAYLNFAKSTNIDENNATVDVATGKYLTTIANNKGIKLPETGGVGTIALSISGTILVAAGSIYYATKKKKREE